MGLTSLEVKTETMLIWLIWGEIPYTLSELIDKMT